MPSLFFTSCRKNIEQGTKLNIAGVVRDEVKNKNLPNAKLYLYGAHQTFYGIYYSQGPLDSTISDKEGKFSFQFVADGSSIDYGLTIGQLEYGGYNYGSEINYIVDFRETMYKFNYRKKVTNAIVKARELNYTKVQLKVTLNPFDSFYIRAYTSGFTRPVLIKGQSIDTTVLVRHLPNEQNVFQFYTQALRDTAGLAALNSDPNPHSRKYSVRRMIEDTIYADMQDTLKITKTITNSLSMPRK